MKPSLIIALVIVSSLLVACSGAPAPASEPASPTPAAVEAAATLTPSPPTETPVPTDTPPPTDTPIPTDTPLPTDTPTTMPTDTPAPEPTATLAPTPTLTPTVELELLPPLTLLEPAEGATFATTMSRPTFRWSDAPRPLADDEYYVLVVTHRDGKDYMWTKTASYAAGDDKTWWVDFGPDLHWQVVTARKRTSEAAEPPTGNETGAYSLSGRFFWYK